MKAQKAFLGDINTTPRYDIFLYLSDGNENSPKGFGALEHHKSTMVVMPEDECQEELAKGMIDVVSHEFFHIVTPLRFILKMFIILIITTQHFLNILWMYEGVTEYFANFISSKSRIDFRR